jgi:hypothetical protein
MKTKGGLLVLTLILCFFASCGKNSSIVKNLAQQNQEEEQPDSNQGNQPNQDNQSQDNGSQSHSSSPHKLIIKEGGTITIKKVELSGGDGTKKDTPVQFILQDGENNEFNVTVKLQEMDNDLGGEEIGVLGAEEGTNANKKIYIIALLKSFASSYDLADKDKAVVVCRITAADLGKEIWDMSFSAFNGKKVIICKDSSTHKYTILPS